MANKNEPIRVVATKSGYDDNALGNALSYALKICEERPQENSEIVLLTHTKGQLEHTSLARMLGTSLTKSLRAKKRIRLSQGPILRHETLRTMPKFSAQGVVVAFYAENGMLDFVDGIHGLSGIVVVPDLEDSAEGWIERWNPIIHGQERGNAKPLIDDEVVVNALKSLTTMVNLSTGISHPRDKEQANEILRILRAKGHQLPADKIKSWAIRNGWDPKGADDLARIADKVSSLKSKPSLSRYYNPNARYERWKKGE